MTERLKRLEEVAETEVERLIGQPGVMAVGITGSLARGDVWERSDLDLVAVLDQEEDVFYVDFNDKPSVPIDIAFVSKALLRHQYHPFLYSCKVVYDPTGVLSEATRTANEMFYSDAEVQRRLREYKSSAEKNLKRATEALRKYDVPSSVLHSRKSIFDISSILMEKSRCLTSHHHRVGKCKEAFKKLGLKELYREFLSAIRLDSIGEKEAQRHIPLLRKLYDISYPFFYQLRDKGRQPQIGFIFRLSKENVVDNRILPIYTTGHYRDFVNTVIEEYGDIAQAIFDVNAKNMDDAITVFRELDSFFLKPERFTQLYINALDAGDITKQEAKAIIRSASKFAERLNIQTYL